MCWLSSSEKASNLNRLSRARSTSPSTQFNIRAILSRVYIQLDARPIEKNYREIVYSWKNSELKSAKQCTPHPQPNSVFAQFSAVYIFNWMLGQLKEGCEKIIYSRKSSELKSAEPCEEKHQKSRPQPNSVFAQFSVVCMFNWMFGPWWKGSFLRWDVQFSLRLTPPPLTRQGGRPPHQLYILS